MNVSCNARVDGNCGTCKLCPTGLAETEAVCSCGARLPLKVLHSAAGWYVGHFCPNCGPWDRVSYGYYATKELASKTLAFEIEFVN